MYLILLLKNIIYYLYIYIYSHFDKFNLNLHKYSFDDMIT